VGLGRVALGDAGGAAFVVVGEVGDAVAEGILVDDAALVAVGSGGVLVGLGGRGDGVRPGAAWATLV
jgi:hypothetical protein